MNPAETTRPLPPTGSAPPPPAGGPTQQFRVGDRVAYLCTDIDPPLQLVGDIVASNTWLFDVRWAGGHGTGRFAHSHEPDLLRPATPADERAATGRHTRQVLAQELARLATTPGWPTDVTRVLRARAHDLTSRSPQ